MSGISGVLGRTTVRGPGQKRWISFAADVGTELTTCCSHCRELTCTIKGSKEGRSLIANTRATAAPFVASAPSPYTVSVGNATTSPRRINVAASVIVSLHAGTMSIEPIVFPCVPGIPTIAADRLATPKPPLRSRGVVASLAESESTR